METKTYFIKTGEIRTFHGKYLIKKELNHKFYVLSSAMIYLTFLLFTVCFTWLIYKKCISLFTLYETISLGAVFATLGSSLVGVFSLICSEQYGQFMDNVRILQTQLLKDYTWERWPFIKRFWRNKVSNGEYYYYTLNNPVIIFKDPNSEWQINFPLPCGKIDFREMSVYSNSIKLIKHKQKYNNIIIRNNSIQDILVWTCLSEIYKNIILYRWSQLLIWTGSCFVLGSIIFSFFYIQICDIINLIQQKIKVFSLISHCIALF